MNSNMTDCKDMPTINLLGDVVVSLAAAFVGGWAIGEWIWRMA